MIPLALAYSRQVEAVGAVGAPRSSMLRIHVHLRYNNLNAGQDAGESHCPVPYCQFRVRVAVLHLVPRVRVPHQLRVHPHPLRLLQPVMGIFLGSGALRIQNRLRDLSHRMTAYTGAHANHRPLADAILRHVPGMLQSHPSFPPHSRLLAPYSSILAPAHSSLLASAYSKRGSIPG